MLPTDAFICWAVIWALQSNVDFDEFMIADYAESHDRPPSGAAADHLYHCCVGDCGCLFFPDICGATVYADRYVPAQGCETDNNPAMKPCACHKLPHFDPSNEETPA